MCMYSSLWQCNSFFLTHFNWFLLYQWCFLLVFFLCKSNFIQSISYDSVTNLDSCTDPFFDAFCCTFDIFSRHIAEFSLLVISCVIFHFNHHNFTFASISYLRWLRGANAFYHTPLWIGFLNELSHPFHVWIYISFVGPIFLFN